MMQPTQGALHGVRVVEFGGLAPASVAGLMLSDLGADVIRIDRDGHPADTRANTLRRGRRSISIDLKSPTGRDVARCLIARADILLEPYRPGVMERLGLGPTDAAAINRRLIYARLTGWGQDGPLAQRAGHDITYLALTGALHPIGPADEPPVPPLNYVADMAGGTMPLLIGILAAMHERASSGLGQTVDAAMIDGVPMVAAALFRGLADGSWLPERGKNMLDGAAPYYRCYECADGRYIAVGAVEPQFYAELVRGLGLQLDDLPAQNDRTQWPSVSGSFAAAFAGRTRDEWTRHFEDTDACVAPVLSPEEAPLHPHVAHRQAFVSIDGHYQPGPVPKLGRTPSTPSGPAPEPGQHSTEILREAGLTDEQVTEALTSGAVREGAPA